MEAFPEHLHAAHLHTAADGRAQPRWPSHGRHSTWAPLTLLWPWAQAGVEQSIRFRLCFHFARSGLTRWGITQQYSWGSGLGHGCVSLEQLGHAVWGSWQQWKRDGEGLVFRPAHTNRSVHSSSKTSLCFMPHTCSRLGLVWGVRMPGLLEELTNP